MKKNNHQNPEDIIIEIQKELDSIEFPEKADYNEKLNNLRSSILTAKRFSQIVARFFIIIGICGIIISLYFINKNEELTSALEANNEFILQQDSILDLFLYSGQDSLEKPSFFTYKMENGKVVTYTNLVNQRDSLTNELILSINQQLKYLKTIEKLEAKISILEQFKKVQYDPNLKGYSYTYKHKNGRLLTYDDMSLEIDSLNYRINQLTILQKNNESKIKLAQRVYDINWEEYDNKIKITSPKVDSALLLLPYFRKNLKYDKQSNSWIITH